MDEKERLKELNYGTTDMKELKFPDRFKWGVATSAGQIEGAALEGGRGLSIWDVFSRIPGKVRNGDLPDVSCDHYNKYKEDIALMKDLGLNAYRFSFSWSRVFPDGIGAVNEKGLDFYDRLIDELLKADLSPNATLYHWDLPQGLEDRGGWLNRDLADWFADYSEVIFKRYSDRVPMFSTLNEPIATYVGYGTGGFAPGKKLDRFGKQACHNILLAHGKAVERFKANAAKSSNIGVVVDIWHRHPARPDNVDDIALARRDNEESYKFFLNPIFNGCYTDYILELMNREKTMPYMEDNDFKLIGQKLDFFGLNCYNRVVVSKEADAVKTNMVNAGGNFLDTGSEFYPKSIYDAIKILHEEFHVKIPIYITENGTHSENEKIENGKIHDEQRIRYVKGFLQWLHKAIEEGADVRGYYLWTLIDNFEWTAGYDYKFGIVANDRVTQKRTLKDSAYWYSDVVKNNRIVIE